MRIDALYLLSASLDLVVTAGSVPPLAAPTLTSPANDANAANPVALDWSDVASATGYEVQVDDASDFAAPLAISQTVTASQTTLSQLTRKRWWWRVRALGAGGVPGTWSTSRSFVAVAAPNATLTALTIAPASVTGGTSATGTVTLSSAAPSAGATVTLSDNSSAATTPASVTVPAGATSANFTVTTSSVASSTSVTLTAVLGANSRTATLTVNAPASGPPGTPALATPANDARFNQGQTITFDWNDVAGAASYQLQVDDSDSFPTPHVLAQTTTSSSHATNTLPRRTLWWRVRAVNASGVAGAWSSVRRVRVE